MSCAYMGEGHFRTKEQQGTVPDADICLTCSGETKEGSVTRVSPGSVGRAEVKEVRGARLGVLQSIVMTLPSP